MARAIVAAVARAAAGAMLLAGAIPVQARDLAVPADKGWKHAETGLILMPQLAGLPRIALSDGTASERDITAQFQTPDKAVSATLYLFHPAVPDVALWFDRSRSALEQRDLFRNAAPASADPLPFAAAGSTVPSSLRQIYAMAGGPLRSTGLAVVPLGEWIVGIRISATTLTADQLDTRLQQLIAAIRWPAVANPQAPAAVPIRPCATALSFTEAKPAKPSGADLLMGLMGHAAAAANGTRGAAPTARRTWCRDGEARAAYGVYRADGDRTGYTLAIHDAGRSVAVFPSIMGQVDKSGTYAVTLTDVDGTVSAYPSFASLPAPAQVWDLVGKGKARGTVKGSAITLDPDALK